MYGRSACVEEKCTSKGGGQVLNEDEELELEAPPGLEMRKTAAPLGGQDAGDHRPICLLEIPTLKIVAQRASLRSSEHSFRSETGE